MFIDFVPAELRENKTWEIVYYCKNPFTNKLQIKRNRVRPLKSIVERRKLAKRMVTTINNKLQHGWTPWITEKNAKSFFKLRQVMDEYLVKMDKEVKKKQKSYDTYRTYKSYVRNINQYLISIGKPELFIINFDSELVTDFIDYIYYDKNNSARTRNNYLGFLKNLTSYMVERKFIKLDPCQHLKSISVEPKKRAYIQENYRNTIFEYFDNNNKNFYTLCMSCYYCLIRRTELTKLRVGDVMLINNVIYIESSIAKNKKSKPVTIPDILIPHLARHLSGSNNSQYLFSANNFAPGDIPLSPKKISDVWSKMRKETKLPSSIQWYSLKDSGITDLLLNGVELLRVRDQARHHSISQTEDYIPKELLRADKKIKNLGLKFNN
ncbi:tyrosine-type recombinase/integrase [Aquimarina megaterium]|uniref:tyrosine-type recombinase/integrase n=1 Tax=Aquimarina megaterium TaxID=1443666 RepID=UPI0015861DF8|nr:site-specific integrase [Aquimarina megaterium]